MPGPLAFLEGAAGREPCAGPPWEPCRADKPGAPSRPVPTPLGTARPGGWSLSPTGPRYARRGLRWERVGLGELDLGEEILCVGFRACLDWTHARAQGRVRPGAVPWVIEQRRALLSRQTGESDERPRWRASSPQVQAAPQAAPPRTCPTPRPAPAPHPLCTPYPAPAPTPHPAPARGAVTRGGLRPCLRVPARQQLRLERWPRWPHSGPGKRKARGTPCAIPDVPQWAGRRL